MEAGPTPTFTASAPAFDKVLRRGGRGDVAGDYGHVEQSLELAQRLDDARRVAVGAIEHQHVNPGFHHLLSALDALDIGAHGRAHAQASLFVLGRQRKLDLFGNILNGYKTFEHEAAVHHRHFFDAVAAQDVLGLFQRGAYGNRDEVLLGHHVHHGLVEVFLEANVAVGEDTHQLAVFGDGHAGDVVAFHQVHRLAHGGVGAQGDGVHDHAGFRALDLVYLGGLHVDFQVTVNDAEAALPRQGDSQPRFGHGVHGGGNERDIEGN